MSASHEYVEWSTYGIWLERLNSKLRLMSSCCKEKTAKDFYSQNQN